MCEPLNIIHKKNGRGRLLKDWLREEPPGVLILLILLVLIANTIGGDGSPLEAHSRGARHAKDR